MNRQNFLGHLTLALSIILLAAFVGQMRRWHTHSGTCARYRMAAAVNTEDTDNIARKKAEVLVRFRPNVTLAAMKEIAAAHNDRVEDQLEEVDGIAVIEDEDGGTTEQIAAEYNAMPDNVEYAEPNYEINLEPGFESASAHRDLISEPIKQASRYSHSLSLPSSNTPNDPLFQQQWSLSNDGQNNGKQGADIGALRAWTKTHGSDKVVIAVLDSGVQYTHPDLTNNMWTRPANIAAYTDDQLGDVDDVHGYNAVRGDYRRRGRQQRRHRGH